MLSFFGQLRLRFLHICFLPCRGMMAEPPELVGYPYPQILHPITISISVYQCPSVTQVFEAAIWFFFLLEKIFTPHFKCNQSWGTATWKTLAKDWTLNYSWTHWQRSVLHGPQEPQFQGAWTPAHLDIIIWIKASRKLLTHSPIAHTAIQQDSFN